MSARDESVANRLLQVDCSVHMDGSVNWVVSAHPDDPTRPGQVVVTIPWQARSLLDEAADEITRLRAEVESMVARGGDRARLTCPQCPDEIDPHPYRDAYECPPCHRGQPSHCWGDPATICPCGDAEHEPAEDHR